MPSELTNASTGVPPDESSILAIANKCLDGDAGAHEIELLSSMRESLPADGALRRLMNDLDRGDQWLRALAPSEPTDSASNADALPEWWRHVFTWVADGTGYQLVDEVGGRHASQYAADFELAARVCSGDERAASALYHEYSPLVRALVRSRGFANEMDDVMQEIFARVFRKLGLYRGESSLKTWLYRVALRHLLNLREQRSARARREVLMADLDVTDGEESFLARVADESPSPLEQAEAMDTRDGVRATLDLLPERIRQVVELRMLDELSCREIGDVLAISEGTVRTRLTQGRVAIGERLRVFPQA